jgi:predicted Fe-Mo cluster-binding NifX family protein
MNKKIIAIPTIKGKLCAHFGRCEKFSIVEVDAKNILNEYHIDPPEHQLGVYPKFLADYGVSTIISGGMGPDAHQLFQQNNIDVFIGVCLEKPKHLVENYLNDELKKSKNMFEHLKLNNHHQYDLLVKLILKNSILCN